LNSSSITIPVTSEMKIIAQAAELPKGLVNRSKKMFMMSAMKVTVVFPQGPVRGAWWWVACL